MNIFVVVVQVITIGICFLISKNMVANQKGLAKGMVLGKDDEETINKMKSIIREIILTGKLQIDEKLEEYSIKIDAPKGWIKEIRIDSEKTIVRYDGTSCEEVVFNNGISHKGAIALLTFCGWGTASIFEFMLGLLITAL